MDDGRAQSVINEPQWSLEKQLGRWSFVKQLTWLTTQTPGTIIDGLRIIQDLIVSTLQSAPFDNFRYVRWKTVRIRVLVNGNKFFPGQLCAFFVPYTSDTIARAWQAKTLRGWTQMQNVMIAANKSGIGELNFDFRYPYNWFDLLGTNPPVGMFYLGVFNQLSSTLTTPPVVDIQIWTQLEGMEFKIPIPATPAPTMEERKLRRKLANVIFIEGQMLEQLGASLGKEGDKILSEVIPDNILGGILDFAGGMDKPTTSANPMIFRQFPEGFLAHADNIEHYPKLQMYPSKQVLSDNEHFATKGTEMKLYDMMRTRPNLVQTVSWSNSQMAGTVLFQTSVGPMATSYAPTSTAGVSIQPTIMDYVSQPFNKWRGAVCFMMQAVATMFNTGRLMWAFYPECPLDEVPAALLSQSSSYVQLVDMKDGIGIGRIVCPYLADTPWKTVDNGGNGEQSIRDKCYTGVLQLIVVTPLVAGPSLPPAIDVNIFTWAGDDYELNVFNYNNSSILEYLIQPPSEDKPKIRRIQGQMYESGINLVAAKTDPAPDVSQVQTRGTQDLSFAPQVMGTEKSTTPLAQTRAKTYDGGKVSHYGEKFASIKDLMKRFYYRRVGVTVDATEPQLAGADPILFSLDPAALLFPGNSSLAWYGRMFRFNRNGYRFKVRFHVVNNNLNEFPIQRVLVTQIPADSTSTIPSALYSIFPSITYAYGANANPPLASIIGSDTLEFEVPYVREENIMITPSTPLLGDDTDPLYSHSIILFALYLAPQPATTTNIAIVTEYFYALSDESMFGTFQGIPNTQITAFNTVNSTWYTGTTSDRKPPPQRDDPLVIHHTTRNSTTGKDRTVRG